jgi:hypothetical protein
MLEEPAKYLRHAPKMLVRAVYGSGSIFVASSFFALGGELKELRQLEDNLQRGRDRVIEQITIMQSFGLKSLLLKTNSPGSEVAIAQGKPGRTLTSYLPTVSMKVS